MKLTKVQAGMLAVVLHDNDDATVYKIESVRGPNKNVELSYLTRGMGQVHGGFMDISELHEPTEAQLYNALLALQLSL